MLASVLFCVLNRSCIVNVVIFGLMQDLLVLRLGLSKAHDCASGVNFCEWPISKSILHYVEFLPYVCRDGLKRGVIKFGNKHILPVRGEPSRRHIIQFSKIHQFDKLKMASSGGCQRVIAVVSPLYRISVPLQRVRRRMNQYALT